MQKRQNYSIIIITFIVAVMLPIFIGYSIWAVNKSVEKSCFDRLVGSSKSLAKELYNTTDMDRTILSAMAEIIAESKDDNDTELANIMETYNNSASYVSYVELLRPDNTMLGNDGTVRDVSESFDYADEINKGAYISGIVQSSIDSEAKEIRNAVPVIKDGKTIYMLYGVVRLSEFAEKYTTEIYDGNAYVYLEDGDTGDFLLDTWHNSFGNIRDFSERKMLPGFDFEEAIADMADGKSGDLGFVSKSTGKILYMHYEPVGINNWNVVITIEKEYAMEESTAIRRHLYVMAAVVGIVILLYMVYVLLYVLRAYQHVKKLGLEDQTTGLQNRNAYDSYMRESKKVLLESIVCIYIDANGLHEINNKYGHQVGDQMLRIIADALSAEFQEKEIYRIGGDEFVVFSENKSLEICQEKVANVNRQIETHGYNISYGIVSHEKELGVNRISQEADEEMLKYKRVYYAKHDRRESR